MRTQYYAAASLDGFLATVDDGLDWLFPLAPLSETSFPAFVAEVGALATGSATYAWILRNATTVAAEAGSPWPYHQPTWVFTHRTWPTPPGADAGVSADVRFVSGDVRPVHAAMRAAAGDRKLWIVGGGDLADQFFDAGLLDEIIVQVGSVTLGRGKPLFPRRALHPRLRLASVHPMGPGMVELRYQVASASEAEDVAAGSIGRRRRARVTRA